MNQSPYIIVSSSMTLLHKLMKQGVTYSEIAYRLRGANALLFTNSGNNNFISFKVSDGKFGVQGTLKLVDPEQEFEERLISGGLLDTYNSYARAKKPSRMWASDGAKGQAFKKFEEANENKVSLPSPSVYIAFGTGPDSSTWAPPVRYAIKGFDIDFSEGKVVTLTLATTRDELQPVSRVENTSTSMGLSIYAEGRSKPINFTNQKEPVYSYKHPDEYATIIKDEYISFHGIICDTLRDLASKMETASNVMVLLPNVDLVCKEAISDIRQKNPGLINENNDKFVEEVLSLFGLTLVRSTKYSESLEEAKKVEPAPAIRVFSEAEKAIDKATRLEEDNKNTTYYACVKSFAPVNGLKPNYIKTISSVYQKIRENMTEVNAENRFVCRAEGDEDILELWGTYSSVSQWPLFQLVRKGPALVLGDVGMISRHLYGKVQESYEADPLLHPADQDAFSGLEEVFAAVSDATFRATGVKRDVKYDPFYGLYKPPQDLNTEQFRTANNTYPFFKFGVKAPNVLSISSNYNAALLSALQFGMKKQFDRINSAVAEGRLPEGFVSFPADTAERRDYFVESVEKEENAATKAAFALLTGNAQGVVDASKEYTVAQQLYNVEKFDVPVGQIQGEITKLPKGFHDSVAISASEKARVVEITTIPYFHLFGSKALRSICGLVTSSPTITQTKRKSPQAISRFLTGLYLIVGIEHSMDSSSAQSRFLLAKVSVPKNSSDETEEEKKEREQEKQNATSNDLSREDNQATIGNIFEFNEEDQKEWAAERPVGSGKGVLGMIGSYFLNKLDLNESQKAGLAPGRKI